MNIDQRLYNAITQSNPEALNQIIEEINQITQGFNHNIFNINPIYSWGSTFLDIAQNKTLQAREVERILRSHNAQSSEELIEEKQRKNPLTLEQQIEKDSKIQEGHKLWRKEINNKLFQAVYEINAYNLRESYDKIFLILKSANVPKFWWIEIINAKNKQEQTVFDIILFKTEIGLTRQHLEPIKQLLENYGNQS